MKKLKLIVEKIIISESPVEVLKIKTWFEFL